MSSSPDFAWTNYLDLARRLASRPEATEASLRSAISRAYYAAFHKAAELLVGDGFELTRRGEDHQTVWNEFERNRPRLQKPIGVHGRKLRDDRRKADYDNPLPEDLHDKTLYALKSAAKIIEEVNYLRAKREKRASGTEEAADSR